jgi:hypothetical protein
MKLIEEVARHNHLELGPEDNHRLGKEVAVGVAAAVEVVGLGLGGLAVEVVEASDVVEDVVALVIVVVEELNLVRPVLLPLCHQIDC